MSLHSTFHPCLLVGATFMIVSCVGCGDLGGYMPPVDATEAGTMAATANDSAPAPTGSETGDGMAGAETGDGMTGGETTGGTTGGADADASSGDPALSGEELFVTHCATCHGPEGVGTTAGYELQHPARDYSTWVVRNGRPGEEFPDSAMAAYPPEALSDDQLESIWDYLDGFPQPSTGEGLYLDYCRNCHGVDALGGVTGVDIRDAELDELIDDVRDGKDDSFADRSGYMPARGPSELTDAELAMIAEHIATL